MVRLVLCLGLLGVMSLPASAQQVKQTGDVSVGWALRHESGLTMPLGIAISDGFRVHDNMDIVLETQFEHGSVIGIGFNMWAVAGGPRVSGGSRYGDTVREFGQVLVGVGSGTASAFGATSDRFTGLVIQPGLGVDVPVSKVVAIRPQFDVIAWRTLGSFSIDTRYSVSAVFRLYH